MNKEILESTQTLGAGIMLLTENECWELLEYEKSGSRRFTVMNRLYGRATKLRTARERNELFAKAKK